jgi:predicted secreted protein
MLETIVAKWERSLGRRGRSTPLEPPLDSAAMDRRLARRNLRTALIVSVIGLLMFALTFVAALLYNGV